MQSNSIPNQSYFAKIQNLHRFLLLTTNNCHFQMTYARGEPWRVIISSDSLLRPSSMITYGQGITAEIACKDALENYEKKNSTNKENNINQYHITDTIYLPCLSLNGKLVNKYLYNFFEELELDYILYARDSFAPDDFIKHVPLLSSVKGDYQKFNNELANNNSGFKFLVRIEFLLPDKSSAFYLLAKNMEDACLQAHEAYKNALKKYEVKHD